MNNLSSQYNDILNEINDRINELDCLIEEYISSHSESIIDVHNFIQRLKTEGLYNEELETFISDYLKYYNEDDQ